MSGVHDGVVMPSGVAAASTHGGGGGVAARLHALWRPLAPDAASSPERGTRGAADGAATDDDDTASTTSRTDAGLLRKGWAGRDAIVDGIGGRDDVPATEDEIVKLRNVHKTYLLGIEGVPALRGVSLTLTRGEFVVILGKSGGGKTSLLNIIGTIDKPTRGDLYLCGTRVDQKTTDAELARIRLRHLGFVFQTFNLLPSMSALENVELPMVLAGAGSAKQRRDRAVQLLRRVGMGGRLGHFPSQMSGGEQQRVTIARALANKPELLLLDEPTGDLDEANGSVVLKILTDLNRDEGVTCIMVTHDVALKAFAHRVIHMLDGKVARIEHIPASARREALAELHARPAVQAMIARELAERRGDVDVVASSGGGSEGSGGGGSGGAAATPLFPSWVGSFWGRTEAAATTTTATPATSAATPSATSAATAGPAGPATATRATKTFVVRQPRDYATVRFGDASGRGGRGGAAGGGGGGGGGGAGVLASALRAAPTVAASPTGPFPLFSIGEPDEEDRAGVAPSNVRVVTTGASGAAGASALTSDD